MALNNRRQILAGTSLMGMLALAMVVVAFGYFPTHPNTTTTVYSTVTNEIASAQGSGTGISTTSATSGVSEVTQVILFGTPPSQGSETSVISANTLAWTSYTVASQADLAGEESQIQISPQNSNAQLILAFYLNGRLITNQTYTILGADEPQTGNSTSMPTEYQLGFSAPVQTSVSPNSVISLAIFSNSSLTIYVNPSGGKSSEAPVTSLPAQLPAQASSLPYTLDIYAYSD